MKDRSEAASSKEEANKIEGSVAEEVAAPKRKLELIVTMYLKYILSLRFILVWITTSSTHSVRRNYIPKSM